MYSPGFIPGIRPKTGITEPGIPPPVVATEIVYLDEPYLSVRWHCESECLSRRVEKLHHWPGISIWYDQTSDGYQGLRYDCFGD
jgi:hypothetical protein